MRYAVPCLLFAACVESPAREPQPPTDAAPAETVTVRGNQRDAVFRVATLYSIEGTEVAATDDSTVTTWAVGSFAVDAVSTDAAPESASVEHNETQYFYRATVTGQPGDSVSAVRLVLWERATPQDRGAPVTTACARHPMCGPLLQRMMRHAAQLRRVP